MNCLYTVITGASRGLGRALSWECARRGMNLILISLNNEGIYELARELESTFNIRVQGIEADLTSEKETNEIIEKINKNFEVNILINNAGIGGTKSFEEATFSYLNNIILLNIRALAFLTHGLIENLCNSPDAKILNIASMASFSPMPYKTVYPASKAFVYSFSRGLRYELKAKGVQVSVAHPGGMATNPNVCERINSYNKLIKSTILSVEKTAEICVRQLLRNDSLIIPGFMNKISWALFKLVPVWLRLLIMEKSLQKEIKLQHPISYA